MRKRIVYTRREDGGVSVCCPTQWAVDGMARGAWGDAPRGVIEARIEASIAGGRQADAAARFIRAMHFGGLTEAEALCVIRDRDCAPHGTAVELWDLEEIPPDRWFRDAWRRSHNGGPITISLPLAKRIQFAKIKTAFDGENQRRQGDIDLFDEPITLNWGRIRDQIRSAQDEVDLRRIWPEVLNGPQA